MTIHCETCPFYQNPKHIFNYPNCDNEKLGWVTCGGGSTVKRKSRACHLHPAMGLNKEKFQAANTMTVKEPAAGKDEAADNALIGGIDFEAQLLRDIEAIHQKGLI